MDAMISWVEVVLAIYRGGALRWRYSGAWGIVVTLIRILSGYFEIFL
nr:hypothetical protein [uncultured Campylobacter sp.]